MWCYLVIGFFDWKIGVFQQTVVRVYRILNELHGLKICKFKITHLQKKFITRVHYRWSEGDLGCCSSPRSASDDVGSSLTMISFSAKQRSLFLVPQTCSKACLRYFRLNIMFFSFSSQVFPDGSVNFQCFFCRYFWMTQLMPATRFLQSRFRTFANNLVLRLRTKLSIMGQCRRKTNSL